MNFCQFARELRRRRVFRVVGLYLVAAWIWLQVMDAIVGPAGLPDWSMTLLLYVEILAFLVAVFLGWRYQITDHGLVRTTAVAGADSEPLTVGPELNGVRVKGQSKAGSIEVSCVLRFETRGPRNSTSSSHPGR